MTRKLLMSLNDFNEMRPLIRAGAEDIVQI